MSEAKVDIVEAISCMVKRQSSEIEKLRVELAAARARLDASEALCERYRKALEAVEAVHWERRPPGKYTKARVMADIARAALSPGDNAAGGA